MGLLSNGELDGVLFTSDLVADYFMFQNEAHHKIGYTVDIIRPFTPVFLFQKNSMLTWIFNQKIEMCQQSGLIIHWIAKYKKKINRNNKKKLKKLSITSFLTILQITAIMYFIAFMVFLMEMFSYRLENIKSVLDYLTY